MTQTTRLKSTTTAPQRQKTQKTNYSHLPLVYSCSGCSSAAQLSNRIALQLDRQQRAEMSCIAGVGGGVKALVRTAKSARKILVLDGCPLHCARHCLAQLDIDIDVHLDLSTAGVKKRFHQDATEEEYQQVWQQLVIPAVERLGD